MGHELKIEYRLAEDSLGEAVIEPEWIAAAEKAIREAYPDAHVTVTAEPLVHSACEVYVDGECWTLEGESIAEHVQHLANKAWDTLLGE